MSAEDDAYEAALKIIAEARETGTTEVNFNSRACRALTRIPPELGAVGALRVVDLSNTRASDLSPLASLKWLEDLRLGKTAVHDLSPLTELTTLQSLDLRQTEVSDLSPLAGLTGLQTLTLNQTGGSDLRALTGLTGLRALDLRQTAVSDLSPLAGLTGLSVLNLSETAVSDLRPLAELTGLQTLDIRQTGVSDLSSLVGLTGLQHLWLELTGVSDLSPLAEFTGLQTLDIRQTGVSDLRPLAELTGLRRLYLNQTGVSDLSPLAGLTGLVEIMLQKTKIIDLSPLTSMSGLSALWLDGTPISNIAPLASINKFEILGLSNTLVTDLRPICDSRVQGFNQLEFFGTPATAQDAELDRLAGILDHEDRTHETLAYLKTLPPWPQPYTPKARPDGSRPEPIGRDSGPPPAVTTAETQIKSLLRHALVTRVTADTLSRQIDEALRDVPATNGNELAPILQMMAEVGEVLGHLAEDAPRASTKDRERALLLRISQLESIVARLTAALKQEEEARKAADAMAKKDGFLESFRKSAGTAAGAGTVGLIAVGVPTAAVYFLGADHPLVTAFLTAIGKLPKG